MQPGPGPSQFFLLLGSTYIIIYMYVCVSRLREIKPLYLDSFPRREVERPPRVTFREYMGKKKNELPFLFPFLPPSLKLDVLEPLRLSTPPTMWCDVVCVCVCPREDRAHFETVMMEEKKEKKPVFFFLLPASGGGGGVALLGMG